MLERLANAEKVRIGRVVQLTVHVKPAQKKRQGRNPRDGRGDHDRGQVSERGRARPAARESEDSAAVDAESTPAPRRRVTPVFRPEPVGRTLEGSGAVTSKMLGAPAAQVAGVNLRVELPRSPSGEKEGRDPRGGRVLLSTLDISSWRVSESAAKGTGRPLRIGPRAL